MPNAFGQWSRLQKRPSMQNFTIQVLLLSMKSYTSSVSFVYRNHNFSMPGVATRAYERGVQGVHRTRARKSSGSRVEVFWPFFLMGLTFSEDLCFFWSSPNSGQKMGLNFSEDLFFWSLGAPHRPSYLLEKFLSEALVATETYTAIPAPRGTFRGRAPKSLLVLPKRELYPPSKDCARRN